MEFARFTNNVMWDLVALAPSGGGSALPVLAMEDPDYFVTEMTGISLDDIVGLAGVRLTDHSTIA